MLILGCLSLAGCFSARVGVGPHATSGGRAGLLASAGLGLGVSVHGRHAIYATPNFGVLVEDHATRSIGYDSIDYLYTGGPGGPVRISGRLGVLFGREREQLVERPLLGAAVAWFPLAKRPWQGGHGDSECEKSCDDLMPSFGGIAGLGVELAVDALPVTIDASTSPERSAMMVTMSLVVQGDLVVDL